MPPVTIYTKPGCPYCVAAKDLFRQKGVDFAEIDLFREPGRRAEMIDRAGGRTTVPQIFIGDRHIGGCDDLYELNARGGLEPLLAA
jgi:glutaredoxin 3